MLQGRPSSADSGTWLLLRPPSHQITLLYLDPLQSASLSPKLTKGFLQSTRPLLLHCCSCWRAPLLWGPYWSDPPPLPRAGTKETDHSPRNKSPTNAETQGSSRLGQSGPAHPASLCSYHRAPKSNATVSLGTGKADSWERPWEPACQSAELQEREKSK